MNAITIVGGGIAGLVAANACAEAGAAVTLWEAHRNWVGAGAPARFPMSRTPDRTSSTPTGRAGRG